MCIPSFCRRSEKSFRRLPKMKKNLPASLHEPTLAASHPTTAGAYIYSDDIFFCPENIATKIWGSVLI
jgi:hypothetical protein